MLGLASRMSRKAWRPPTRQSRESTSQRLALPRLTPLRQPHTREHSEAGMTGLLGGRGAGMRAAASSKPASACPWTRDGRRPRFRWPSERPRKKGVRKTDPKRGPPDTRTTGLRSENGLLFFRKSRWVLGFRLRCFQVCARPESRRPQRRRGGILRSTPQLVALRHTCTQTKRVRAPTQSATFVEQLHSRPRRSAMMQCEMLASACSVPPSRCWPVSLTLMGRRPSCHRPFWAASASCRRE